MEVAALGLKVEGTEGIDRAASSLDRLTQSSGNAEKATAEVSKGSDKVRGSLNQLNQSAGIASRGMSQLGAAAVAAGSLFVAAFSISAIRNYADAWSDMRSVVGASIGDMSKAGVAMSRLVDIANASYSPLQQTVDVYSRNVTVLQSLGRSASEAADFTESLNNMLVLTATRGERAASVQNALSKAMAVGKLQADGLETVLANGGEVAKALANELGTTVNGLRQLATDGKITGSVIANAIIKPLEDVKARAAEMPATVADAFVRVNTNITEFVGKLDQASGASSSIAGVILNFADGIRRAGDYIIAFGVWAKPAFDLVGAGLSYVTQYADIALAAVAGFAAPALIAGVWLLAAAIGTGLVSAVKALTAVMLANPIGLIVGAIAAATYAVYKFRDDIQQIFGINIVQSAKTAANFIIGSFVAAFEDIKFVFNNFDDMIGAAVFAGVNAAIRQINRLTEATIKEVNAIIQAFNKIPGVDLGQISGGAGQIELIYNVNAENFDKALAQRNKAIEEALSKDYLGDLFSGFTMPTTDVFGGGGTGKPTNLIDPKGGKAAADAAKQNAEAINQLAQSYYLAGLNGEELAVFQAKLSLNTNATKEQVEAVEMLARGIYAVTEAEKQRQKFGENAKEADKYILGQDDPLSGGAFDNQIARYDAEAVKEQERYDAQMERLTLARELQIATIRSYDQLEEEAKQQHSDRMIQIEQAKNQTILQGASQGFSALAGMLKKSQGEQSGAYKAMFAASKAFALASAAISFGVAIGKAWELPWPANLAAAIAASGAMITNIATIQGTGLKGMAHSGIDSIPETGTWLLEKGERVTTANTSAKMDAVLERIDSRQRSGVREAPRTGTVVNIIESQERAGQVETRTNQNGEEETDMFVADIYGGGKRARAMQDVYGLRRVGT